MCKKTLSLSAAASVLAGILLLAAQTGSHADQRDFPFTYSWFQASKGEKELAFHTLYQKRDNFSKHELEFEYGVSDRFSLAPYIVLEQGEGRTFHYDAVKLETRYQLGNYKTNTVLPGLYLEIEKPNGAPVELEGKLILSRFDNHGGNLSFNYIIQKVLERGAEYKHTYSLGYALPVGHRGNRLGAEFIHELSSGRLLFGPTFFVPLGSSSSFNVGYAYPLNGKSDNKPEFRLFAQHHWF